MCSAHKRPRTQECAAPTVTRDVLNPLRSEDEAFRFLLYAIAVIAVIAAIVVLILILRALL
ncbi:MAG TPA: hypothetical protein VHY18_01630 [Solirubrobacteraceae bacterium]|nr:hypothetical protein [Solirubrobacteraceae bacterium]